MAVSASEVLLDEIRTGDAGWIVMRHAEMYAEEEGFDATFEPLVARTLTSFLDTHDPERERGWIARARGRRLGSIFCVRGTEPATAKLRLFLLEREVRGIGLGQRMLDTCLDFACAAGYSRMTLWTHESHRAACALYAKSGFICARSEPVRSFGVDLVEQKWTRDLGR